MFDGSELEIFASASSTSAETLNDSTASGAVCSNSTKRFIRSLALAVALPSSASRG
jgi:hypothetical protein